MQYGKILSEEGFVFAKERRTYRTTIVICCTFCGHARPELSQCVCDFAVDTRGSKGLEETLILSTWAVFDMLLSISTSKQV